MSYLKEDFRLAAAECQKDVDEARMQSNWMPPNGRYASQFSGMEAGAKVDETTGAKSCWIRLDFVITDGDPDLVGREFCAIFTTKQAWKCGELFELASALTGDQTHRETKQLVGAAEALEPYVGKSIIEVVVDRNYNKKSQREFTSVSFDRILDTIEAAA